MTGDFSAVSVTFQGPAAKVGAWDITAERQPFPLAGPK
jgi:hypothetical protein